MIVPELPDAADEPAEFCERLARAIGSEVNSLAAATDSNRIAARLERYRRLGLP